MTSNNYFSNIGRLGHNSFNFNLKNNEESSTNKESQKQETPVVRETKSDAGAIDRSQQALGTYGQAAIQINRSFDINKYCTKEQFEKFAEYGFSEEDLRRFSKYFTADEIEEMIENAENYELDFDNFSTAAVSELGVSTGVADSITEEYINNSN